MRVCGCVGVWVRIRMCVGDVGKEGGTRSEVFVHHLSEGSVVPTGREGARAGEEAGGRGGWVGGGLVRCMYITLPALLFLARSLYKHTHIKVPRTAR